MKVAVVLPRGMVFSEKGGTSIDLVVKDQMMLSAHGKTSYVVGQQVDAPFVGVDFRGVPSGSQTQLNQSYLQQLKADPPQVIVVHQYPQTAAFLAKKLPHIPVVLYRHGLFKQRSGWLSKWRKQSQFKSLAKIVFVSDFIRSEFLADFPNLSSKCATLHNAVDTSIWHPALQKQRRICFAGRARQDKGILELILAFQDLNSEQWTLDLVLAVQTDEERAFHAYVEQQLQGAKNINLLTNLTSGEVQATFAKAQIAALPSIVREGFPRAVVEALSSGCATIATRSGGTPEAIGEAGILLETATRSGIKEALQSLMDDPKLVEQWSHAARQHALSNLDLKVKAAEYDALISSVLGSSK